MNKPTLEKCRNQSELSSSHTLSEAGLSQPPQGELRVRLEHGNGRGPRAGGTACPDSPCRLHAVLPQQRGPGALGPPVLEGYPPSGTGGRVAEGVRAPPELRGVRAFLGKRLPGRGHGGRWRSSWRGIARRSVLKGSAGGIRPEALCPTRSLA